jgi:hypothetical protein
MSIGPSWGVSSFVGALPLLVMTGGCVEQPVVESPAQLAAERAKTEAAEQRVVELERRLAEVERLAQTTAAHAARPVTASNAPDKIDRLVAAQERLVERLVEAQAASAAASLATSATSKKPTAREPVCRQPSAEFAGFGARLQDLFERAQTDLPPWRGGLSREKREALRILLREDRELDGQNPLEL